jgi:hypothetical protein
VSTGLPFATNEVSHAIGAMLDPNQTSRVPGLSALAVR